MLDIKLILNDSEKIRASLEARGAKTESLAQMKELSDERKKLVGQIQEARTQIKALSKEIGPKKKKGEETSELMQEVAKNKKLVQEKEVFLKEVETKIEDSLLWLPNLLSPKVPLGKTEENNVEVEKWGVIPELDFTPKDHVTLGENLGQMDFEGASNMTGARFSLLKGPLARLERALISFMIDRHLEAKYLEVVPPYLVHEKSLVGSGQLPKFAEDLFKIEGRPWYLIPTAEVPLVNIKREQTLSSLTDPLRYCAYTPCFRSEAGSYGKDTRGLIRLHQFNKVELVMICHPEQSEELHEEMVQQARSILEALELPYRVLELCSGDLGFCASRTLDLEVYLPSQKHYREISSISNCLDFQARRANIRFRDNEGKLKFAHSLNGSGVAVGRAMVAILENYQQADGSILIPQVLRNYMGGASHIRK